MGHRAHPRRAADAGHTVSAGSVRRSRWRRPARPPSQTWRAFLRTHAAQLWAADLCVVQTVTFQTLDVLRFISHGRRELVHLAVTAHPTAAWVWRQSVKATPWGRRPRQLIRDRDRVSGGDFRDWAVALGIDAVLTPVRAPRAKAIADWVIGPLRRECLEQVIPLNKRRLPTLLAEDVGYANHDRPHRPVRLETPRPPARPHAGPIGTVRACPVLNGLPHVDERAA